MSSNQESEMLWKVEPLSPSGTPPLDIDEEWLLLDEKPALFDNGGEESSLYEEQLTRAQVATRYLEELELKTWIKEESFADWLEEKIDLPIFEELPGPESGQNRAAVIYPSSNVILKHPQPVHQQHQQQQVLVGVGHHDTTQSLLQEFETVLGDVEACHQVTGVSTLTPPQSPPPSLGKPRFTSLPINTTTNAHLFVSLQPIQQTQTFVYEQQHQQHLEDPAVLTSFHDQQQQEAYAITTLPISSVSIGQQQPQQQPQQQQQQQQIAQQWNAEQLSLVPLGHASDVANELAQVDAYVRSCAEDVPANPNMSSNSSLASSSAPPSPCESSNASCMSSEDSTDDPDWSYENAVASTSNGSSSSSSRKATSTGRGRRASNSSKPYSRVHTEDKRSRKKEQNKNAATRYRQKKKQEVKEILGEEQELVNKNDKLQAKVTDLQREIGYLKGLMRDLFKAKGLMK